MFRGMMRSPIVNGPENGFRPRPNGKRHVAVVKKRNYFRGVINCNRMVNIGEFCKMIIIIWKCFYFYLQTHKTVTAAAAMMTNLLLPILI